MTKLMNDEHTSSSNDLSSTSKVTLRMHCSKRRVNNKTTEISSNDASTNTPDDDVQLRRGTTSQQQHQSIAISNEVVQGVRRILLFSAVIWWSTLHFQLVQCLDGDCGPIEESLASALRVRNVQQVLTRVAVLAGTAIGVTSAIGYVVKGVAMTWGYLRLLCETAFSDFERLESCDTVWVRRRSRSV